MHKLAQRLQFLAIRQYQPAAHHLVADISSELFKHGLLAIQRQAILEPRCDDLSQ